MAIRSQADQRRNMNAVDQFGRKWNLQIEISTGDPTGQIAPIGFDDPLRTPMNLLRVPREDGQPAYGKLVVDFPRWIKEQEQNESMWRRHLLSVGKLYFKAAFNPATAIRDPVVLEATGPMPWPSVRVLKMAQTGDRRFLGQLPLDDAARALLDRPNVDDLLAKTIDAAVLPDVVDEPEEYVGPVTMKGKPSTNAAWVAFLREKQAEGMKYPDITTAWREQKALAAV